MLRLASVGSGSKGNATLIASSTTTILVDCGFTVKELIARLESLAISVDQIDAILVTHEHGDHIAGVAAVSRAARAPVYSTHGTLQSGRLENSFSVTEIASDSVFAVGDIEINAITVPHDAREPVQFRFQSDSGSIGVLTDLGSITPHVCRGFSDCELLLLEFNHDLERLRQGPYPASLKRRVSGDYGHLNNQQAMTLLERLSERPPKVVVAGHISEQNNSVEQVATLLEGWAEPLGSQVVYASQTDGFGWLSA